MILKYPVREYCVLGAAYIYVYIHTCCFSALSVLTLQTEVPIN